METARRKNSQYQTNIVYIQHMFEKIENFDNAVEFLLLKALFFKL